jgi:predicted RNase H-like HicB family nuclease
MTTPTPTTTYVATAVHDPEDDAVIITFPEVPGCHTFAESFAEAERLAIDVLALWLDVPADTISIQFDPPITA